MNKEVKLATSTRSKKPRAASNGASLGGLRSARQGFASIVFCDGKTQQEIVRLARKLLPSIDRCWCLGFRPRSRAPCCDWIAEPCITSRPEPSRFMIQLED